ncbi:MAG: hypothetical protein HY308_05040 [Gammaproteobacteria bacterium]|nr:hypothetical protein [Gammaproteobacteria bacterium]
MTDVSLSTTSEWLIVGRAPDPERVLGDVIDEIKKYPGVVIVHIAGPEASPRRAVIRTTGGILADLQATFGDRVVFAPNAALKLFTE